MNESPLTPLLSTHVNDPIVASLLEQFCRRLEGKISQLTTYVQQANWPEVSNITHELQGSTSQYGFPTMSTALAQLSAEAKKSAVTPSESGLVHQLGEVARLMERIKLGIFSSTN